MESRKYRRIMAHDPQYIPPVNVNNTLISCSIYTPIPDQIMFINIVDETTYNIVTTALTENPNSLRYGVKSNNRYCFFDKSGSSRLVTSTDGTTFSSSNPTMITNITDVCWSGDYYLAVGVGIGSSNANNLSVSSIGTGAWSSYKITEISNTDTRLFNAVTYGNGTYVAVGSSTGLIGGVRYTACASSSNATSWTARTIPIGEYVDVIYDIDKFIAVGSINATAPTTSNNFSYSTDGITWTAGGRITYSSPGGGGTVNAKILSISSNGGIFVCVGDGIWSSYDGITWTNRVNHFGTSLADKTKVIWNGNMFITIDSSNQTGSTIRCWISYDGISWKAMNMSYPGNTGIIMRSIC